jgi:hypothetical protein
VEGDRVSIDAMPVLPAPLCEWQRNEHAPLCGAPATEMLTMHDVFSTDPAAQRVFLLCNECLTRILQWAQREHQAGNGSKCRGCGHTIRPMLGAVIIAHGELAKPDQDVRYDQ